MKFKPLVFIVVLLFVAISFIMHSFLLKKKVEVDPIYITLKELNQYNGENGQPTYVAVDNVIYDLTRCRYWKKGVHNKSPEDAIGGRDLTEVLKKSKHGMKRVKRYPLVGYLVEAKEE